MSLPMTKADVIARFNAIVRDQLSPSLGAAPHYFGYAASPHSSVNNNDDLGPRAEPPKTIAEPSLVQADAGAQVANSIFNLLHNFAMSYTRVRQAKSIHIVSGSGIATEGVQTLTALKEHLTIYFDLPQIPPVTGLPATSVDLEDFLESLRNRVNGIRNDPQYMHIYGAFSCHSSCHVACHGSRGRR